MELARVSSSSLLLLLLLLLLMRVEFFNAQFPKLRAKKECAKEFVKPPDLL
jgi:hypothetical protein